MYYRTPPKKPQVPLDDAPAHAIPAAMRILRAVSHAPCGLIFGIDGRAPAMAALHSAGLVDLVPTLAGMHIMRRASR